MQIVIDIPEQTYEKIMNNIYDYGDMNIIIQNGTVLPKHGRLIDIDKLLVHEMYGIWGGREKPCVLREDIEDADTILEANK